MSIVYHGGLETLAREVTEAKEAIDQRYLEILGPERYQQLVRASRELLGPRSFFDSPTQLNEWLGREMKAEGSSNSMLFLSPLELNYRRNGKIRTRNFPCSVAFCVSEDGFRNSHSATFTDNPLASYVHEFDHFVWFALQKVPIYLVNQVGVTILEPRGSRKLEPYMADLMQQDLPPQELKHKAALAMYLYVLEDMFEKANRILDKNVLEAIGIDVPLEWRGQEKTFSPIMIPTGIGVFPTGGDPFKDFSDQEVIDRMINWERKCSPIAPIRFVHNIIESVKRASVLKYSLEDLERLYGDIE